MAISKRKRFEVLKRDNFTCQYCSAKPPKVPLEVDHIFPISKGGKDTIENLITACFDCNRGKSNIELTSIPESLIIKTEKKQLALSQYKQYQSILKKEKKVIESQIKEVEKIYSACFEYYEFSEKFKLSVKSFISKLGLDEVAEAMEKSCSRIHDEHQALKYFCGICWSKINDL